MAEKQEDGPQAEIAVSVDNEKNITALDLPDAHQIQVMGEKTRWQRFDDWFWCDNHVKFQEQSIILNPFYEKDVFCISKCVRVFGLLLELPFIILGTGGTLSQLGKGGLEFFVTGMVALTSWGLIFTFFWFCIAIHTYRKKGKFVPVTDETKHSPWQTWKWFIFLFELVFVMNWIVSIIYWTVIYFAKDIRNEYSAAFQVVSGYIHAAPLLSILAEFSLNALPLVKRHGFIMPLTGFLYCIVNFTHAKVTGKPIYDPVLMWNKPIDYIFGFGVILLSIVIFTILYLCNQRKLRSLQKFDERHPRMAEICETPMFTPNSVSEVQK